MTPQCPGSPILLQSLGPRNSNVLRPVASDRTGEPGACRSDVILCADTKRAGYCEATVLTKRIIPCLDVDAGRVVKGTSFVDLRDAGDPAELAALYNREGGDELVFLDITASSDSRDTMVEVIERVSEQVFIPPNRGRGHPKRRRRAPDASSRGPTKFP